MTDPTNINVPPKLGADPANVNVPVHGTKYPSGVTGADSYFHLNLGTDLGDALTGVIADSWKAPCAGYIRKICHMNYSVAAVASFLVLNSTQSLNVIGATTPTTNTAAEITSITTPSFAEGDVIQLKVTTSGGSGAVKGLNVHVFYTELAGSTVNPV